MSNQPTIYRVEIKPDGFNDCAQSPLITKIDDYVEWDDEIQINGVREPRRGDFVCYCDDEVEVTAFLRKSITRHILYAQDLKEEIEKLEARLSKLQSELKSISENDIDYLMGAIGDAKVFFTES